MGNWISEVKEVRLIKVDSYGEPYNAIVTLKIVNGQCNVESLLSVNKLNKADILRIQKEVVKLGFTEYVDMRNVNGEMVRSVKSVHKSLLV